MRQGTPLSRDAVEHLVIRHAWHRSAPPSGEKGWLGVYERTVRPLSEGATLRG
ncbi:MAG TPA: hypothetical protein VF482_05235 [Trebonia sp.]